VGSHVGRNNSWTLHGETGGWAAYSFRNTTCNLGDVPEVWNPVLLENLYRLKAIVQIRFSGPSGVASCRPDPNQQPSGATWLPGST
jgi:hypothetical protein